MRARNSARAAPALLLGRAAPALLLAALAATSAAPPGPDPDLQAVAQRLLAADLWPAPPLLARVAAQAEALAGSLNATCYWPDVVYNSTDRANWLTTAHLARVLTMATTARTSSPNIRVRAC